ncbi:MAG: glycosyltransferase family 1 protein [Chitinophagaceae bacterium]|nr:glycosyltransferase family 1 protein [Rubrivivax sp.]
MQPGDTLLVDDFLPLRRSLRVALVTETYPPEVNGVAATIARVVDGLRARQHELQLIRPRQDKAELAGETEGFTEVLLRGLPIPRYPQLKMGMPSKRALVALWTRRRPDVVHIVTEGPLGWSALAAAAKLRLPVVSDFRTNFHAYSRHYGVAWLHNPIMAYLRKFHNRTACTMVPTESLKQQLAAAGFRRLQVVARGVDTQLFDPRRRSAELRQRWGADGQSIVVLCVGRLAPEKNLGALAATFEAMAASSPRLKLVLVGDGPARSALQARLPGAVFAGLRHGTDLAEHYASADVFLFPSLTETFGNVVPEALASGLAVVAYDYAAAGQLMRDDDSGLLARYDDLAHLQQQACRLAADASLVRRLAANGRAVAERMDWGRIVTLIEAEYDAALRVGPMTQASVTPMPALPARP